MKKILYSIAILFAAVVTSCSEWDPVFANQGVPDPAAAVNMDSQVNTSIADLKALYTGKPYHIEKDIVISGKIISSDISGNIYRSVYIQDETGAIEVKIGSTGLYNDYKLGFIPRAHNHDISKYLDMGLHDIYEVRITRLTPDVQPEQQVEVIVNILNQK